jgi:hypothetical protein
VEQHCRIIDKDINAAETLRRRRGHGLHVTLVRDIRPDENGRTFGTLDSFHSRLALVAIDLGYDYCSSLPGKAQRYSPSNTSAGSGNQSHPVL